VDNDGDLERDTLANWQTVEWPQHRRDVLAAFCASYQPCRRILHRLETLELGVGYVVQQRVAVVETVAGLQMNALISDFAASDVRD